MAGNTISNQGEIKRVVAEMTSKTDTVIATMKSYNFMLKKLQEYAIKDDLINAKLSGISLHINEYRSELITIYESLLEVISQNNDTIKEIDKGDFADFVQDNLSVVEGLINRIS